jgi:2',3'-cyclic-nucleotide 2'-phosphodiesterase / 3'-nucleotidase / 5'-nucleotidase
MSSFRSTAVLAAFLGSTLLISCTSSGLPVADGPVPGARGTLVLMSTTDVHGWLLPIDYYTGRETENGLARLVPRIDSIREANPGRTLLFDSGDLLQGNPLNFVHRSPEPGTTHPVALAMNALRYDAAAIGNHEFNYGIEHLDALIDEADFPFVSANIFHHGTDERAYVSAVMLEREVAGRTVRIGVTGVTPPGVHLWDRHNVEGRLEFREIVSSLRPVVEELRADGADLVVVAAHNGLEGSSYDVEATGIAPENAMAELARTVDGIDVIFLGHTHQEVADSVIGGALVLQAKNWAASLAVAEIDLVVDASGDWRVESKRGSIVRPAPGGGSDRLADILAPAHRRTMEYVGRTIGHSIGDWSARTARVEDTPILDLINEIQREVTGADLSAASAFNLTARLPEGPVSVADVAGLYVYDNTLRAVRLSGAQLRAYLEKSAEYYLPCPGGACERVTNPAVPGYNFDVISGVDYTLDISRPVGERVVRLERNGRQVAPDDSFTMAINNYRASGAGGYSMLHSAPVVYDREEGIRELLIREIERRGTIAHEDFHRRNWEIVPSTLAARALAEMTSTGAATPGATAASGDRASSGRTKRLRVLGTNDFHGHLAPTRPGFAEGREVGGASALSGYFTRERAAWEGPTILIDGGDVMQGTVVSNLSEGRATVDVFNEIGYTAAALGNHEFDWGIDVLRARIADAEFAWLGANIYRKGTDSLPDWVRPTATVTLPGCGAGAPACDSVRVGIIGIATQETPTTTRPSNVVTLDFGDEAEAIDRWVPRLREEGADFVIVTAHSGAFCDREDPSRDCHGDIVDVARRLVHRPDLIVSGHTHSVVNTVINGIRIVQAGSYGTRFSIVDLERVTPDSVSTTVPDQPITYVDAITPEPAIVALVERHEAEIRPLVERVVTQVETTLTRQGPEWPLGNLVADAQRAATGTQIALMNNGGIRTELLAGPVRYGDLFRLQPFNNLLVTMELTGAQVLTALEHAVAGSGRVGAHVSGISIEYDPTREPGGRIVSAVLDDGSRLDPEQRYSFTVNDFLAERGDGFAVFGEGTNVIRTGIVDLDALILHLEQLPQPVQPPATGRIRSVR